MKLAALVIAAVGMVGCALHKKPMTNDEVITETKKCQAAGMAVRAYAEGPFDPRVTSVICIPKQ